MPGLFGYIDPVSGTMVLQLIIASVAGAVAWFLKPIGRLLSKLVPGRTDCPPSPEKVVSVSQDGPERT